MMMILIQEIHLSLTNRATHLCIWRGSPPHVYYHADVKSRFVWLRIKLWRLVTSVFYAFRK